MRNLFVLRGVVLLACISLILPAIATPLGTADTTALDHL